MGTPNFRPVTFRPPTIRLNYILSHFHFVPVHFVGSCSRDPDQAPSKTETHPLPLLHPPSHLPSYPHSHLHPHPQLFGEQVS
jgi:hypothetical protein